LKNNYNSFEEVSKIVEVQMMKRLPPHPNILKMYEVLYDLPSGKVAVVFEDMESDLHTLNSDRPDNETITESKARSYIFQIL
jgi:renal tumor antigen